MTFLRIDLFKKTGQIFNIINNNKNPEQYIQTIYQIKSIIKYFVKFIKYIETIKWNKRFFNIYIREILRKKLKIK